MQVVCLHPPKTGTSLTLSGTLASIQVHDGFQKTFARTASLILGNVTAAIQSTGATKVRVVGHSLGAAIAMMDAVYLRQHLDPAIIISTHVLGLPRGGNQEWADLVDSTVLNRFLN